MGGNIYKIPRLDSTEYYSLIIALRPILYTHFGDHYRIPIAYGAKPTFGDADIILDGGYLKDKNWLEPLMDDLGNPEYKRVRNVWSILFQGLQVDLFVVDTERFLTTYNFMCYNILGNLIGRLYHKFNLKYGQDGLFYVMRGVNNHISKEVMITTDMKRMLEFVDLSYERWEEGFDALTEIFDYVIGSKYFTVSSYSPDFFNVKKRALERPDFNTFLDYLKDNNVTKDYPFDRNKDAYLPLIDQAFPEAKILEKIHEHHETQIRAIEVSKKFNGKIILELIPMSGKELGVFIDSYKKWKGEDFEQFILQSNQGLIDHSIKTFHRKQLSDENQ